MDKAKILTVDDSPDMLFLEKMILEQEGFEVLTANNGKTALEIVSKNSDLSLILCDVQMETMDGLEFVARLKADHERIFNETPVVLVTGLDEAPRVKVAGIIQKNMGLDDFAATVKSFVVSKKSRLT